MTTEEVKYESELKAVVMMMEPALDLYLFSVLSMIYLMISQVKSLASELWKEVMAR